jgi:hypothetical protein
MISAFEVGVAARSCSKLSILISREAIKLCEAGSNIWLIRGTVSLNSLPRPNMTL